MSTVNPCPSKDITRWHPGCLLSVDAKAMVMASYPGIPVLNLLVGQSNQPATSAQVNQPADSAQVKQLRLASYGWTVSTSVQNPWK